MAISLGRDANRVPVIAGTLNTDGTTVVALTVNPSNNALRVSDGTTGSSLPFVNNQRDANRITTWWGVSSADGVTPIPIYCTAGGMLLVKST